MPKIKLYNYALGNGKKKISVVRTNVFLMWVVSRTFFKMLTSIVKSLPFSSISCPWHSHFPFVVSESGSETSKMQSDIRPNSSFTEEKGDWGTLDVRPEILRNNKKEKEQRDERSAHSNDSGVKDQKNGAGDLQHAWPGRWEHRERVSVGTDSQPGSPQSSQ